MGGLGRAIDPPLHWSSCLIVGGTQGDGLVCRGKALYAGIRREGAPGSK